MVARRRITARIVPVGGVDDEGQASPEGSHSEKDSTIEEHDEAESSSHGDDGSAHDEATTKDSATKAKTVCAVDAEVLDRYGSTTVRGLSSDHYPVSPSYLPLNTVGQRPNGIVRLRGAVGHQLRRDAPEEGRGWTVASRRASSRYSVTGSSAIGPPSTPTTDRPITSSPEGGGLKAIVASIARRHFFESVMWLVVLASTMLAGLETDIVGEPSADETTGMLIFQVLQMLCLAAFTVELFIHVRRLGWDIFLDSWILVDFMLLVFGVYDVYFGLRSIESASDWSYSTGHKLQLGSAMRAIRLIRPVSLVRHSSGLGQLWVLVSGIASTLRSLAWISLVLGVIMFMVASYLTLIVGQATDHLPTPSEVALALSTPGDAAAFDNVTGRVHIWPELSQYFGNIGRSMLTCLQLVTLDNWYVVSREVAERNWAANLLIIAVVYTCSYGMLKALLGVVVERVMAISADNEEERGRLIYQLEVRFIRSMRSAFERADIDGSGTLRWEEFESCVLSDRAVKRKLALIDIDSSMIEELFKILDVDDSGHITCDEFIGGLLRLRGQARGRDMLTLRVSLLGILERLEDIEDRTRMMNLTLKSIVDDVNQWTDLFLGNRLRCQAVQDTIDWNAKVTTVKRAVLDNLHTGIQKDREEVVRTAAAAAARDGRGRRSCGDGGNALREEGLSGAGRVCGPMMGGNSEPSTESGGYAPNCGVEVEPSNRAWGSERRRRETARMAEIYKRYKAGTMSIGWDRPPIGTYNCLISPRGPTLITAGSHFRMVICEAPARDNAHSLALYLKKRFGVTELVRVSSDNDARYPREAFEHLGIGVHDLPFADGCAPPDSVVEAFLEILDTSLYRRSKKRSEGDASPPPCVAIHCISGLGRSPAMVALGLIEREKMEPSEAVRLVRKLRSSRCLTKEQSTFLLNYVPRYAYPFGVL
ncbi:Protein tyrosine phosphatase type IVA 1 [Perkinsus olseni]|uniref:Protein tyrosine phosphatase type IVA 1 n=1 Tax=Perkinsus olseni TaxID=32597 RepID=A0A7J6MBG8_PEROL|nr:Protein tyrosine phosphatase type IVA 1 [Perkinsus olseni]